MTKHDQAYISDSRGLIPGLPDNAEPEISLEELPIWREHPDYALFLRTPMPWSALKTQMLLVQEGGPGDIYSCFLCGAQHAVREGNWLGDFGEVLSGGSMQYMHGGSVEAAAGDPGRERRGKRMHQSNQGGNTASGAGVGGKRSHMGD